MSNQLARSPQADYALTVLNGPDKGATYKLVAGRVTLGRGSDNDIVVKDDPKISRNHAIITVTPRGVEISDVSDRNKVILNGEEVTSRLIPPGAVIQLGETKFQFKILSQPSGGASLDVIQGGGISSAPYGSQSLGASPSPRRSSRRSQSGGKTNFYILVAVIGILFAWLLSSNGPKNKAVDIRSDEDVASDISASRKVVEDAEAERQKLGLNSRQYEEAQPNFVKGFRDYRKGQYERAIESFQACLSLFPAHVQCQRYLSLTQKKFSELIQYHMVLANRYRAQNQYTACKSEYRNAMVMLRNPEDKTYVEAKAGFDACETLEGERY
jgi:pSer/pThr/pTyr-binding forkhead associated (FHA) protein